MSKGMKEEGRRKKEEVPTLKRGAIETVRLVFE
jgi:hypothetical protein